MLELSILFFGPRVGQNMMKSYEINESMNNNSLFVLISFMSFLIYIPILFHTVHEHLEV